MRFFDIRFIEDLISLNLPTRAGYEIHLLVGLFICFLFKKKEGFLSVKNGAFVAFVFSILKEFFDLTVKGSYFDIGDIIFTVIAPVFLLIRGVLVKKG